MTVKVKLVGRDVSFDAPKSQSILDAALSAGVQIGHSCKTGQCGACKATLFRGDVLFADEYLCLTPFERERGVVLTCISFPQTDVELDVDYFPELARIEQKIVPCKVSSVLFPVPEVSILRLRVPPNCQFNYLPGQYLDLTYSGVTRSYSIAAQSVFENTIELHIRKIEGGLFSSRIFDGLKTETLMRLRGPLGTFFVREGSRPLLFIAGGTGFAPVKAMIERLILEQDCRSIYFYWGLRHSSHLYSSLPIEWAEKYTNIRTKIVVSDDYGWEGAKGLVHEVVVSDFPSFQGFDVYVCGAPAMIAVTRDALIKKGLESRNFHADAFHPSVAQ